MANTSNQLQHSCREPTLGSLNYLVSCTCDIDPRERLIVSKIERGQLEDRYLRLLERVQDLKKLSNSQEDKIKRLATKLMRYGSSPVGRPQSGVSNNSSIGTRLDPYDERDKLAILDAENAKLRNKVCILRNQLMTRKIFASSASSSRQSRRVSLPLGTSTSGPATRRSESNRQKSASASGAAAPSTCRCGSARAASTIADENDLQNYALKIQDMEADKREMMSRIAELEIELAGFTSGSRREKVAENIEYIRLRRQMKRQGEKLADSLSANEVLCKQVYQLKCQLEDCSKSREQASTALEAERRQLAEQDDSASRLEESRLNLREKDDRIGDLVKEIGILQQHNRELLDLSTKFAKVEQENDDLRRKLAEQLADRQALDDVIGRERAGAAALQTANDELLVKLHDLQKNIDLMTIQLMEQNEKHVKAKTAAATASPRRLIINDPASSSSSSSSQLPTVDEEYQSRSDPNGSNSSTSQVEAHDKDAKKCSDDCDCKAPKTPGPRSPPPRVEQREKGIQTTTAPTAPKAELKSTEIQTDQTISPISPKLSEERNKDENDDDVTARKKQRNNNSATTINNFTNSCLSREGMLRLLEQVQISAPLESQGAAIVRRGASLTFTVPTVGRQNCAPSIASSSSSSTTTTTTTTTGKTSALEAFLFGDTSF